MQFGESFLVIGAIIIFTAASVSINGAKLENERIMMESELMISAEGLAQSFIEEAKNLSFDNISADTTFSGLVPDEFSEAISFGCETGESYPLFNDIDDYSGFSRNILTERAGFRIDITVSYADSVNLIPGFQGKTLYKYMDVRVTSAYFADTVKCGYLFSFY